MKSYEKVPQPQPTTIVVEMSEGEANEIYTYLETALGRRDYGPVFNLKCHLYSVLGGK